MYVDRSRLSRNLVLGVEQARELHPGRTILLKGISAEAYQAVIFDDGLRYYGLDGVYITPEPGNSDGKSVDPGVARHDWQPPDTLVRWMPGRASVRIAGPKSIHEQIVITGFAWAEQLRRGPIHMSVAADGGALSATDIPGPDIRFEKSFPVSESLVGKDAIHLELKAWPVARIGSGERGVMIESIVLR